MKKVICIIAVIVIAILLLLLLTGCNETKVKSVNDTEVKQESTSMFIEIEKITDNWRVVYHRDTKVMYAVSSGSYNRGIFTLLVNPDGSPMLYEVA